MAITYPESVHAASAIITRPSGAGNGSVLIGVAVGNSGSPIAAPSGWTEIGQPAISGWRTGAYYKVITNIAGEPSSYTFTGYGFAGITRCEGVDTATPLDVVSSSNAAGVDAVIPAITTVTAGALVLCSGFVDAPSLGISGQPEIWNESSILGLFGAIQAIAGTTGSRTVGSTGSESMAMGTLFALRPAAGGAGGSAKAVSKTSIGLAIGIG